MKIIDIITPEEMDIYDEGFEKAKEGITVENCPYKNDTRESDIWLMGFYDFYYE